MENIKGLFIIGNKRSGSTQMMRLLNLHPKIFISNETDILWILYHFHNSLELKPYPHDSPTGMNKSLELASHLLDKKNTVEENFVIYQKYIMKKGFLRGGKFNKTNLFYLGDQKPYQNAEPKMIQFILENFKNAKFIHLIRHPFLVTASSKRFLDGNNDIWGGLNEEELMDKWCFHEKNVKKAIAEYKIEFFRIKYSDMVSNTKIVLANLFDFLELKYDDAILSEARKITKLNFKPIRNLKINSEQKELMFSYGFPDKFGRFEASVKPFFFKYYNKIMQKIQNEK